MRLGDVVEDVVEETVADSTEGEVEEQVAEARRTVGFRICRRTGG